jgi:hypothetical protein
MHRHSRLGTAVRRAVAAWSVIALLLPVAVSAAGDLTPPVGSAELWDIDNTTQLLEVRLSYADPESGLDHLLVICDGGPDFNVPYTTKLLWPMHDGTGGCSTDFGEHSILIQVYNGDGLTTNAVGWNFVNAPTVHLTVSANPTTGHPVTFTPVWTPGYTPPPSQTCMWELRWGTTTALDQTFSGDTFGGMTFSLSAADGGCGPWTMTLPWVPYPQFDVRIAGNPVRFMAAVDSTERRITSSSLPIAQVLPSTYTPIVGQPLTYTRYLIGGTQVVGSGNWSARLGDGANPLVWAKTGGSTFTFTPPRTGDVFVEWNQGTTDGDFLDAYFDPPVRYPDTTAPVATAPGQAVRPSVFGSSVPLTVDWSGSDRGWGVASYQLQRSVNGGAWSSVTLSNPAARSAAVNAAPGSTVRFRVRAKDKAGNLGSWAYGTSFRVTTVSDADASIAYTPGRWRVASEASALDGAVHATSRGGSATLHVSARAVAWIALRGPHLGRARVYVDGVLRATVDLSADSQSRAVVFAARWGTVGTHTIQIVNAVTFHRPVIDVDGFVVLR